MQNSNNTSNKLVGTALTAACIFMAAYGAATHNHPYGLPILVLGTFGLGYVLRGTLFRGRKAAEVAA